MSQLYENINRELASNIRLVMSDVDGTLTTDESIGAPVVEVVHQLEGQGIKVGLVSGRPLKRLEMHALAMGISGPIIAENGGVAQLSLKNGLLNLGYSREPALRAFEKLRGFFPGYITELLDNKDRLVDVTFSAPGINRIEMMKHLSDVQFLDSGYMFHILPAGITKGNTLKVLLTYPPYKQISQNEIIVFGDSATDMSLFTQFPNSVLVLNPLLSEQQRSDLHVVTRYHTEHFCGDGFVEVCRHILNLRREKADNNHR